MKTPKYLLGLILLLALAHISFAQSETVALADGKDQTKRNNISPELKKEAAEFLRNTEAEVNNMRTLENRISFSAEIAGLMWFYDEPTARGMYGNVINSFRNLLAQYDGELNAAGIVPENIGVMGFGMPGTSKIERKFGKALSVRKQITVSLSEHDPRLAFEFFTETAQVITNPKIRKQIEESDADFETRLLKDIAENDVETALKYAKKNLDKGFNYETISLLRKIYDKDPEKGAEFGNDIVGKIKSESSLDDSYYAVSGLFRLADEKMPKPGEKRRPVLTERNLSDLAEVLAVQLLKDDEGEGFESYLSDIEKYAPSRAIQIRSKFKIKKTDAKNGLKTAVGVPKFEQDETVITDSSNTDSQNDQKQLFENIGNLANKELDPEKKKQIVEQSRNIINSIGDRSQKIIALSALAFQVSAMGDKSLASDIIEEARRLTNYQPVNYQDYIEIGMVVNSYATIDPEKAFPLLESAIYRLNDTIAAFVKVGEFIDVNGDMVDEGEIQLGSFGGGMTRGLLSGLGTAVAPIRQLAIADFKKTKELTNRFDRQEVRVLAKMLVLRAIFGNDKETSVMDDMSGF